MKITRQGSGKGPRIILTGVLVLLLLAGIGLIIWSSVKKAVVRRSIVNAVRDKSKGLYNLWYKKLDMNEVAGTLHVQKLTLAYNMEVYRQTEKDREGTPVLISAQIPDIYVTGVKTVHAMLNREITGRRIMIDHPVIEVILTGKGSSDSSAYNKAFYKELLGKLEMIRMDTITISNAIVHVRNIEEKTDKATATGFSLQLKDMIIDSVHAQDKTRLLFSSDLAAGFDSLEIRSKTDKYHHRFSGLHFSQSQKTLTIGKFSIIPQLNEPDFAKSFNVQKDRFDIVMENIMLKGIDIPALTKKEIRADSLIIQKGNYKIYRDLSYKRSEESRVGKYPHQLLMKIKVPLSIGHLICSNAFVEYKEKNPRSDKSGRVQFYDTYAHMRHITNIKKDIDSNNKCTVNVKAKLLNKALLEAALIFYLNNPDGKFSIKGTLHGVNATALNPLSEPMALVKIDTGYINKLSFMLTGDNYTAQGRVLLLYRDLKISLLKKEKETNTIEKRPLASFAANLVVKDGNPGKNNKVRIGSVQYKRDTTRSFFNLIWKSIFAGVKESVGLKE